MSSADPTPPSTPVPAPARGRDRDEHGRPQNARPRDRTGRPLAYDTDVVDLVEEVDYATVEEALAWGVRRWREGRFFEAHECLEDVWHAAEGRDSVFWQGVIQVAVTYVHHQRDNPDGVVSTVHKALPKLEPVPDRHLGVDVAGLRAWAVAAAESQATTPGAPLDPPPVAFVDGARVSDEVAPGGASATPLGRRGGPHLGNVS